MFVPSRQWSTFDLTLGTIATPSICRKPLMFGTACRLQKFAVAMLIPVLVLVLGCEPKEPSADAIDIEDFATRYAAAWSSQDPAALASFYADDGELIVNGGTPSVGRDAVEATARAFMEAFPDMVVELVKVRQGGQTIIFEWHWTGTNTGPGGTGNVVDILGFEEWTLDANGQIRRSIGHYDQAEYERQVNADQR